MFRVCIVLYFVQGFKGPKVLGLGFSGLAIQDF